MSTTDLMGRFYPGDRWDGTKMFYDWLRSSIRPSFVMLNLGAGRTSDRKIRCLRGEVARVVGADIDPAVLQNEDLDEAVVIRNDVLPFADSAFDGAWADYVLEHVEHPERFLRELHRVLKPGGSFFFRTPNKYHYVCLIGRATPYWFHHLVANRVRGLGGQAAEPYPTFYRLNSVAEVTRQAHAAGFAKVECRLVECEPSYLAFHPIPFLLGVVYERTVNRWDVLASLRANIFGRLTKQEGEAEAVWSVGSRGR